MFSVAKSLEATEHLNRSIIMISLLTIIAILVVSLLINRWLLRRLWKPFYATLTGVEKYRLGEKPPPNFENSGINEFNLLNDTLRQFIRGAEKEYFILKEFTENASRIANTLAIVRSTLDVMIQDEKLSDLKVIIYRALFSHSENVKIESILTTAGTKLKTGSFRISVHLISGNWLNRR